MTRLVDFAKKVESDNFNSAESKDDYYHKLAEKIYKIHKELSARQKDRDEKKNQNNTKVKLEVKDETENTSNGQKRSLTPGLEDQPKKKDIKMESEEVSIKTGPISQDDLQRHLLPVHEVVWGLEDASLFHFPVDPIAMGIPDYPKWVSNPTDLSTIKEKLMSGKYASAWDFADEMALMFRNATIFNKKVSRAYKITKRIEEKYKTLIEPVLRELGYG